VSTIEQTSAASDAAPPSSAVMAFVEHFAAGWRAPADADSFADHFIPFLAPDVRMVQPQMPTLVGHRDFREGFARPLFATFPGLRGEIVRWAGTGDVAFIELALHGMLGGAPISWQVVDRILMRDGLVAERVAYSDPVPLLRAGLTRPRAWPRILRARTGR
jgi:hypothetical protein